MVFIKKLIPILLLGLSVHCCFGYNLLDNGDFAASLSDWSLLGTSSEVTKTAGEGNPDPGAELLRVYTADAVNSNGIYQAIPVTVGKSYQVYGQWKGDLRAGIDVRNWTEVYVLFDTDGVLDASEIATGQIVYKKRYDSISGLMNLDSSGIWDWEDFTDSPNTDIANFENNFVADDSYMIVYINLGGRALAGNANVFVDNIILTACQEKLAADFNLDCVVDVNDLVMLASSWLDCKSQSDCN